MSLDFKMPSGLGFFLIAQESKLKTLVAIGIKWHCKKLLFLSYMEG